MSQSSSWASSWHLLPSLSFFLLVVFCLFLWTRLFRQNWSSSDQQPTEAPVSQPASKPASQASTQPAINPAFYPASHQPSHPAPEQQPLCTNKERSPHCTKPNIGNPPPCKLCVVLASQPVVWLHRNEKAQRFDSLTSRIQRDQMNNFLYTSRTEGVTPFVLLDINGSQYVIL